MEPEAPLHHFRSYRSYQDSFAQRSVDRYNCFLLTDQAAVEQAVHEGATRLTETDIENPF